MSFLFLFFLFSPTNYAITPLICPHIWNVRGFFESGHSSFRVFLILETGNITDI